MVFSLYRVATYNLQPMTTPLINFPTDKVLRAFSCIFENGCRYSMARHIPEHFNTLFSGTEQLFNISLHVNSSCLGP